MTGVRITVDSRDVREVQAALRTLATLGRDPAPALRAIGLRLVASTRNRIVDERTPDGGAFTPLNPEYAAAKRGPGILRERAMRGGLFGSIVSEVDGPVLRVGTNKVYGAIHQFGGTIRPSSAKALVFRLGDRLVRAASVTIPARPFLGISAEDRQEIAAVFAAFVSHAGRGRAVGA